MRFDFKGGAARAHPETGVSLEVEQLGSRKLRREARTADEKGAIGKYRDNSLLEPNEQLDMARRLGQAGRDGLQRKLEKVQFRAYRALTDGPMTEAKVQAAFRATMDAVDAVHRDSKGEHQAWAVGPVKVAPDATPEQMFEAIGFSGAFDAQPGVKALFDFKESLAEMHPNPRRGRPFSRAKENAVAASFAPLLGAIGDKVEDDRFEVYYAATPEKPSNQTHALLVRDADGNVFGFQHIYIIG